ncbi:MAG: DUF6273 domain-containing protein [Christensenellaceae bacterium]|jgi:hypothetical protein|nr:DUF6273 domain-containing protein [Christensenellaceae bacterium]
MKMPSEDKIKVILEQGVRAGLYEEVGMEKYRLTEKGKKYVELFKAPAVEQPCLKKGDKVKLYGHEWLVVWTDGATAKLWMTEPFAAHIFDENRNDYEKSSIRKWLKKQEANFGFGDGVLPNDKVYGDKLWLPSRKEVGDGGEWGLTDDDRKFSNLEFGYNSWLRSPSAVNTYAASYVYDDGTLHSNGSVNYAYVVRPAIMVDLEKFEDVRE